MIFRTLLSPWRQGRVTHGLLRQREGNPPLWVGPMESMDTDEDSIVISVPENVKRSPADPIEHSESGSAG